MTLIESIEQQLRSIFSPEEADDIVEWLELYVQSIPYSPIPGAFRIKHTPWIAEPLRACVDPENKLVALLGPVQAGKSTIIELLTCYIIAKMSGPTLCLQDNDPNARDWYDSRLRELWKNCPPVMSKYNDSKSRVQNSVFDRMRLYTLGAHNKRNLQRRSIRWCIGDEVWQWPKGHIKQARSRVEFFGWLGKCVFASQGGVEGDEWTDLWNSTNRKEWTFKCSDCGTRQPFVWEQVVFPDNYKNANGYDYKAIEEGCTYRCCNCSKTYADNAGSRAEMNETGEYVVMNGNATSGYVGYHWNALAVRSWGGLAVDVTKAKETSLLFANDEPRKLFKQQQLALPWSDDPDEFDLNAKAGDYKMESDWDDEGVLYQQMLYQGEKGKEMLLKGGCRLRMMGIDVQQNGFYYVIRQYAVDGRSRLFKWGFVSTFEELMRLQVKSEVHPTMVCIDSGFRTDDVYRFSAEFGYTATKGSAQTEFPWRVIRGGKTVVEYRPYKPPARINFGKRGRLILFSNLALKDTLTRLRKSGHHSYSIDAGEEYDKQMTSEVRTKLQNGKAEWRVINNRANHIFDCEVMCLVPAMMLKIIGRRPAKSLTEESIDSPDQTESSEADQ